MDNIIKGKLKNASNVTYYPETSADMVIMTNASEEPSTVQAEIIANRNAISGLGGLTTLKLHTQKLGVDGFELPASPESGDAYFVGVAGTYGGLVGEVGDQFVYANSTDGWMVLQANLTNAVIGPNAGAVDENLAVFDGTSGTLLKDSTLTKAGVSTAVTVGSTLDGNKDKLAKIDEDSDGDPTYDGVKLNKVGIPTVASGGDAPANLIAGGLYFEAD